MADPGDAQAAGGAGAETAGLSPVGYDAALGAYFSTPSRLRMKL